MTRKRLLIAALALGAVVTFASCDKDDAPATPVYEVPATYNFTNVDYTDAASGIAMWSGFTGYLGRSTTRQLSQDTVNYLWNNTNSAFTSEIISNLSFTAAQLNGMTTINLSGKTTDPLIYKAYADSMVKVSAAYATPAVPGAAGFYMQSNGTTKRLVNYTGLEFNQLVAKGLMGSFSMKKIYEHLDKAATADNNTVVAGKGTAMQHEWDMAFGYVGIPKDYDSAKVYAGSDITRPLAIGGYFAERGKYIKAGGIAFEAFRKGRAAIGAKHYAGRDQAAAAIKEIIEKTLAAAAYVYVSTPQTGNDLASKLHALSEAYGFIIALKYRPANSKLTAANYQLLVDILSTNFYTLLADASNTKLKQAQSILTTAYGQLQ